MLACYSNALSAYPGEVVDLFISGAVGKCALYISRIGTAKNTVQILQDILIGPQPTPINADQDGCGWSLTTRIEIGLDWQSGYYSLELRSDNGEIAYHFICVKSGPHYRSRVALILATNTYHAYNWWGGRNSYGDMEAVVAGRMTMAECLEHRLGIVSTQRPFAPGIINIPPSPARFVNEAVRGFNELPTLKSRTFYAEGGFGPLDGATGFINKWEHIFVAWAEKEGIGLDYWTDYDLESEPDALSDYACAVIVGHSEYWSAGQRDQLDRFVDNGGNLAIFSGNTSYWQVRWENNGTSMICHKSLGFDVEPDAGKNASQLWSHPVFERPEAALTGLSFLFGGYHRLGMCVARGTAGYTVYDDLHWSLEGTDLFYGDSFGGNIPLLGYENDGCRLDFDDRGKLCAQPSLGVPENLEVIAVAPAGYAEDVDRGYDPILVSEDLGSAMQILFGEVSEATRQRLIRGHAVMASFRRGAGSVFNSGTTEWAYGLKAKDPFVERITRNVMRRFGACVPEGQEAFQ